MPMVSPAKLPPALAPAWRRAANAAPSLVSSKFLRQEFEHSTMVLRAPYFSRHVIVVLRTVL